MSSYMKGFFLIALSAICFGCMPALCHLPSQDGLSSLGILLYRFGTSIPSLLIICLWRRKYGENFTISWELGKKILVLSAVGYALTASLLIGSYEYISGGVATVLHFSYPIFVLIGSTMWLKRKASIMELFSIALCLWGIMMTVEWSWGNSLIGYIGALVSGVTYAFYIIYADLIKGTVSSWILTLYLSIFSFIIVAILYMTWYGLYMPELRQESILSLIVLGQVASTLAVALFQLGLQYVNATTAAIGSMLEPISALLIGVVFLGESLTITAIIGCILVGISLIIMTVYGNKRNLC